MKLLHLILLSVVSVGTIISAEHAVRVGKSQLNPFGISHVEILLPFSLPRTSATAPDPRSYTSTQLTSVPGFFVITPRGQEPFPASEFSRLDLHFDRDNFVSIDPSLYSHNHIVDTGPLSRYSSDVNESHRAWNSLKHKITEMNKIEVMRGSGTRYKVVFFGRHGQGYHNAAERFYGMHDWECYWAMQGTNGTHTWGPDAKLTPNGISEAEQTSKVWRKQISFGAPVPERHFVSPLSRSILTMETTWGDVYGWDTATSGKGSRLAGVPSTEPVVKEILRETLSLHYSDHRSSLSTIHKNFPYLLFSPLPTLYANSPTSFPEEDPFWDFHRESNHMRDLRIKTALQEILTEVGDKATYVAITCHYGVIESALRVLGHEHVNVGTAGVVPVVVKMEDGAVSGDGGWYEKHAGSVKEEIVKKVVCDGFPEVWVQGEYVVPGGMGVDEL